jgi:hypothetical protein
MSVDLISYDDPLWSDALLSSVHDVYHTPGWIAASKHCDDGQPMAVYVEAEGHKALFPFLRRELPDGLWDATSAYGYGGPVFSRNHSPDWVASALDLAIDKLKDEGCVSWFVRLHPILNASWQSNHGVVVDHGPTVSVDLSKSAEHHWRETMSGHRGDINKATKAGVTVHAGTSPSSLDAFVRIYHETMTALGASGYYFFKDEYFQDLVDLLGEDLLLMMAMEGGEYIGGSMFTLSRSSQIMQYHLSGTASAYRHRQPSKVILHAAREWGREHGFSRLHLGGGVGAQEDALFKFKRGFSPDTHLFQSHRIVVNSDQYARLCQERGAGQSDLSGFFPAYRQR